MTQLRFKGSIGRSSRFIIRAAGLCLAMLLIASLTFAQSDDENRHVTLSVGGTDHWP